MLLQEQLFPPLVHLKVQAKVWLSVPEFPGHSKSGGSLTFVAGRSIREEVQIWAVSWLISQVISQLAGFVHVLSAVMFIFLHHQVKASRQQD